MKTSSLKTLTVRHARAGFTLVELLLVITMVAVLSTLAVGVMASAQDDARAAATRSRVRIITSILEQEIEDYEVRQLPVSLQSIAGVVALQYSDPARALLQQRNLSRRLRMDLIRSEMPSTQADVFWQDLNNPLFSGYFPSNAFVQAFDNRYLEGATPYGRLTLPQRNFFVAQLRRFAPANALAWQNFSGDLPAEFLYEILSRIDYNGASALDAIGSQAVGDSDGDGLLEVVDGWDDPMEFVIQQKYLIERLDPSGVPTEQWGENVPGTPFANTLFPVVEFTDLGRSLPNVAGDLRVLVTSEKLREIDYSIDSRSAFPGPKPEDFEPTVDASGAVIASPEFISTVTFPSS